MTVSSLVTARTALFTPAIRPERILKAAAGPADAVIADLEDAVAAAEKDQARDQLVQLLCGTQENGRLTRAVAVRVNPPGTDAGRADLEALRAPELAGVLDAVLLPKLETPEQVAEAREALGPEIALIGTVESAAGLLVLEELTSQGLARLAVGALDLAFDLGCAAESATMAAALARIVTVSRARGLPGPLASPTPQFRDLGPLTEQSRIERGNGFTGKLCIHPAQLEPAARAFAPTEQEIDWARTVVSAADGATAVDGAMVDAPVIARARAILDDGGNPHTA